MLRQNDKKNDNKTVAKMKTRTKVSKSRWKGAKQMKIPTKLTFEIKKKSEVINWQ